MEKQTPRQIPAHVVANPFGVAHKAHIWTEGDTLKDILVSSGVNLNDGVCVLVNGHLVPREFWHAVHPKTGTLVTVNCLPRGGDSGALRVIATIAIVVLAAWAGGYLFGPAGGFGAGAGGGALGTSALGAAFVSAGVFTVGMLAVNALIPLSNEMESGTESSNALSIAPSRNLIRPFGVAPMLLGTHRIFPPQAANPFTELGGDDEYVTMMFYLSHKDLIVDSSTAKLGDNLLSNYSDYQIEYDIRDSAVDGPITLYNQNHTQATVGILIPEGAANVIVQAAAANTTSVVLDITFLEGLADYDHDGTGSDPAQSNLEIGYRVVGSSPGTWTSVTRNLWIRRTDLFRISYTIDLPNDGQSYEIGAYSNIAISGAPGTGIYNKATWATLHSKQTGVPVNDEMAALCALKIKATDQLSGIPDTFNVEATSRCPDWNGALWVMAATNNPASLLRYVLTGSQGNSRALTEDRIDDAAFQAFWTWCDTEGYAFNLYVDFNTTVDRLRSQIAAAGRARCFAVDEVWTVVIDKPQSTLTQLFTPRNVISFSGARVYPDEVHAFRVRFISEEEGWKNSERIVYRPGYAADALGSPALLPATKFEVLEFPGVTDPDQIWNLARYWHQVAVLQPETFALTIDSESLVNLPGDKVTWSEDSLLIGIGAARIESIVGNPATSITLDTEMSFSTLAADEFYGFTVRREGTAIGTFSVDTPAVQPNDTFDLTTPTAVAVGDLITFGEFGAITQDLLVRDVSPGPDLTATLTCVPYDVQVYDVDSDTPPVYDPVITDPVDKPAPGITSVRSGETGMPRDASGVLIPLIAVSYETSGNTREYVHTVIIWRPTITSSPEVTNSTPFDYKLAYTINGGFHITGVEVGVEYEIRLANRYYSPAPDSGYLSTWTETTHTVLPDQEVPPDVDGTDPAFTHTRDDVTGTRTFDWSLDPADTYRSQIVGYNIRWVGGATADDSPEVTWGSMSPLNWDLPIPDTIYITNTLFENLNYRFAIKAINNAGNESANATYIYYAPDDIAPPVWVDGAFTTSAGADATTQIDLSIDPEPIDAISDIDQYDLHNADTDALVLSDVIDAQTISNLTPNTNYPWYIRAYDETGNASNSNSYLRKTDANVTEGAVGLTSISFSEDEDAGDMAITLGTSGRTGGGSGNMIAVKVETINRTTAGDGTAYYGRGLYDVTGAMTRDSATEGKITETNIGNSTDTGDWLRIDSTGGTYSANYTGLVQAIADTADTVTFLWSQTDAGSDPGVGNDDDGAAAAVHTGVVQWLGTEDDTDTQTINIKLKDQASASSNDMFETQIEYGSEDTGDANCTIDTINSALCLINSSGSGVAGYQQESSGDLKVVIETEAANVTLVNAIKATKTNEAWAISGANARLSPEGGSGQQLQPNNADSNGDFGTATVIEAFGPYASIPISFTQTGDHTINARAKRQAATHEKTHFALERALVSIGADSSGSGATQLIALAADHGLVVTTDYVFFAGTDSPSSTAAYQYTAGASTSFPVVGVPNTDEIEIANTGLGAVPDASDSVCFGEARSIGLHSGDIAEFPSQSNAGWRWTSKNSSGVAREFYIGAVGSYNLRMYEQDYQAQIDKIAIAPTSAGYNPNVGNDTASASLDDKYGALQSAYSSGVVPDNPENPTLPSVPLPDDEMAATTLYPLVGDSNIPIVGLVVQATFPGTGLTYSTFTVSANGENITGAVQNDGTTISFTASGSQPENTLFTNTLIGTIYDENLVLKKIELTGTDWQFTTIDSGAASTLMRVDFSNREGGFYSETMVREDWNVNDLGYESTNPFVVGPDRYQTVIVEDPADFGAHGNVLRITHPAFNGGIGASWRADFGEGTPYTNDGDTKVYFAYDVFIDANHDWVEHCKMPGLMTGTRLEASHNWQEVPTPESVLAFNVRFKTTSLPAFPARGDGACCLYYYNASEVRADKYFDPISPSLEVAANQYTQPKARWITVEIMVDLGTPTPSASGADGEMKAWVVDPSQWTGAKLVANYTGQWFRSVNTMNIDGIWFYDYYGGDPSSPTNEADHEQYNYYDNFIVSTDPITH